MNLAVLISGGKDSALALYKVLKEGYSVKYLVTIIPQNLESWMFHSLNVRLTDLFAKATNIPLIKTKSSGVKEKELEDLKTTLGNLDVDAVVSGAVFSRYQKSRIDRICNELNLSSIVPIWHEDPVKLIQILIKLGFQAIITGVYAQGFDRTWLGKTIDKGTLDQLIKLNKKNGISIIGEGGEYETLVLDAPYFKKRISIIESDIIWENDSGYLLVKNAELREK